jgi:Spy/CpxP family protein refolding chaperone
VIAADGSCVQAAGAGCAHGAAMVRPADAPQGEQPPMMREGLPGKMPGAMRGQMRGGDFPRLRDLTDEQREAMGKLREDSQKALIPLQREMQRLQNDMRGEMLKDEPALSRMQDLTRQLGELRTRIQQQRLEQRFAMRRVLTQDQRDRLLLQQPGGRGMGPRMQQQHGRRGWGGSPMSNGGPCHPGMACPGGVCGPGMTCAPGMMMGAQGQAMACTPGMACPAGMNCAPGTPCGPGMMCGPGMTCVPTGASSASAGCTMTDCPMGGPGCCMMSWNQGPLSDPDEGFEGNEEDEGSLFW